MDADSRRRLIMMKSPIQHRVDDRPRCEGCGNVLTRSDFEGFWDGQSPRDLGRGAKSKEEYQAAITPRICTECCEKAEAGRK